VTAIGYSGTRRYFRQKSRRVTRSRWKGAVVWYCVLAIGGFFALNWIYQVNRKPGELFDDQRFLDLPNEVHSEKVKVRL
jgi:hypothetical protein